MELQFEDFNGIPVVQRERQPNPFAEKVAEIAATVGVDGKSAKGSTAILPTGQLSKLTRLLHQAGRDAGVTIRKTVETRSDDTTLVKFWATTRVVRPRKNAQPDAAEVKDVKAKGQKPAV